MSVPTLGQQAIGPRDGDYLEFSNQWAHVVITAEVDAARWLSPTVYAATGDVLRDGKCIPREEFRTVGAAITYALKCLAIYQEGRAS